MNFHHLVEINDPLIPLIEPLTRAQLWNGLVLRAESPERFMPHLDRCVLSDRTDTSVARALTFGKVTIRDVVHYQPQERVVFEVPAQGEIAASTLTISIEERGEDAFFVRFDYSDSKGDSGDGAEAMYDDFRRSAYKEADIDTIAIIRELAAEGRLDLPPA